MVYALGFNLDNLVIKRTTIRERQRYVPADRNAGAIVRKMRYRIKVSLSKGPGIQRNDYDFIALTHSSVEESFGDYVIFRRIRCDGTRA